jgi:hypothetical protein
VTAFLVVVGVIVTSIALDCALCAAIRQYRKNKP